MNCIECGLPMATPKRPDDPFVCATCRNTSSVRVHTKFGDCTFALAVCDVFKTGEVTVSCSDPAHDALVGPLRVFAPGTWIEATTYDKRGNPLHTFRATDLAEPKSEVA